MMTQLIAFLFNDYNQQLGTQALTPQVQTPKQTAPPTK